MYLLTLDICSPQSRAATTGLHSRSSTSRCTSLLTLVYISRCAIGSSSYGSVSRSFPLVYLSTLVMIHTDQIIFGTVIGVLLGYGFRHLMKFCQRHDLIDRQSYVAQYVSLAMLTVGTCTLLGVDDLLASFACGTTFAWDGFFNRQTEESNFSSVIDLLFNVAAFVFVGAWMPFDKFNDHTLTLSVWRLIVMAILILLLKRLPIMVLLYKWIPDVKSIREAIFSGHFGPMGVGTCSLPISFPPFHIRTALM